MSSNWITISPSRIPSSNYEPYYDQIVVVCNARGEILITPTAYETLGNPNLVTLHVDSHARKFGIRSAIERPAFAVQGSNYHQNGEKRVAKGMKRITCKQSQEYGMGAKDKIVIYRAQMDDEGTLTVDLRFPVKVIDAPVHTRNSKK